MVTLDRKEAIEGGVVKVNCSVPEEKAPVHFTIKKFELNAKDVKQSRRKTSEQNWVMLEFTVEEQDRVIYFQCQASIMSGKHMEDSRSVRSDMVTVRGQSPALVLLFFFFCMFSGLLVRCGEKEPRIGSEQGAAGWAAVLQTVLNPFKSIVFKLFNCDTVKTQKQKFYKQYSTLICDAFCYFLFYSI